MKQYRYTLSYFDIKDNDRKVEIYSALPEDRLDELDAEGVFWTIEVTTEEAAKIREEQGVWKGLYY